MVKTLVTSSRELEQAAASGPVADEEIEPEAMDEIIRRVELMRRGEDTVLSNEEVLRDLDPNFARIAELLDEMS